MINVQTVYPCGNCHRDIDPRTPHCPQCGSAQDHSGEEHFNLFRAYGGGEVYNLVYGGIILSWEDILQLASNRPGKGYFIGSFIPKDQVAGNTIRVAKWIPVIEGRPGLDQGGQEIQITNLE